MLGEGAQGQITLGMRKDQALHRARRGAPRLAGAQFGELSLPPPDLHTYVTKNRAM